MVFIGKTEIFKTNSRTERVKNHINEKKEKFDRSYGDIYMHLKLDAC